MKLGRFADNLTKDGNRFRSLVGKCQSILKAMRKRGMCEMAALIAITCPKCGGNVHIPAGSSQCFCMFCGASLHFDDGSKTVVFRNVDEARIKEAEIAEAMELRKMELDKELRPSRLKTMALLGIVGLIMVVVGYFAGHSSGDPNSPWYMVSLLGMFPLVAIPYIWLSMNRKDGQ